MSLIAELKRRNVFKVGAAYVVLAWLLAQAVDVFLENFGAPDWVIKTVLLLLVAGFPLALFFAWAFEMTPEGIKKEKDVDRSQSITAETGRKLDYAIIAILLMALGYFAFDKFVQAPARTAESVQAIQDAEAVRIEAGPAEKSIAVLPLVNMSSDPEQEFFSDGISEEILNSLARIDELKVAGRTSSFAFKGQNQDLKTIGEALRVAHILEGSVRKSGNKLRITAQLIKVDDGYHMWSDTYDRELTDVFAIQDEISTAILQQLKAKLLGDQQPAAAQADPKAYELYLLARQRIYDRTRPSLEMAATLLNESIGIDPAYAPTYAQLGIATLLLSSRNYGDLPEREAGVKAKEYFDQALAIDSQSAEAMAGMGLYYMDQQLGDDKSADWLEQSLAINPNQTNANTWLASNLERNGHIKAGLEIRERTFARDPLHAPTFGNLTMAYVGNGQTEKAFEVLEKLRAYLPGDATAEFSEGMVCLFSRRLADSVVHFELAYEREPLDNVNRVWFSDALIGTLQYEKVADIGTDAMAALALSRLNRPEEALILGYRAVSEGSIPVFYFRLLVENERFEELAEFVETRWPDLDAFEAQWPGRGGLGNAAMGYIAFAYGRLGNEKMFDDAMARFQASLNAQVAEGVDNYALNHSRAIHAMLSGDRDAAIAFLQKAFQQGLVIDPDAPEAWDVFRPLEGDPGFEAARSQMTEYLDAERQKLGLEPLTT
jgi:TolB-like protein